MDGANSSDIHLLRQAVRSDSHSDREHSWHSDRNTTDEQHKQVVNSFTVLPLLMSIHDYDFDE